MHSIHIQKEIIKNHNDHFIKNIRDDNHKNHQLINEEAIHFDFGSTSHQRALALIASLASNFINRTKTEFKIEINIFLLLLQNEFPGS
jgi:hypothetical protein